MSPFLLPALISALIAAAHILVGGREVARPLLQGQSLAEVVTLTHYYCWHLVSATLIGIAAAFAYAALEADGYVLAVFGTIYAGVFCLWGLVLVLWKRQRHVDMPQWVLFAVLTASGLWALGA